MLVSVQWSRGQVAKIVENYTGFAQADCGKEFDLGFTDTLVVTQ